MENKNNERRNFIKKAAYVAPAILTLSSLPSIAQSGSGSHSSGGNSGGGTAFPGKR